MWLIGSNLLYSYSNWIDFYTRSEIHASRDTVKKSWEDLKENGREI